MEWLQLGRLASEINADGEGIHFEFLEMGKAKTEAERFYYNELWVIHWKWKMRLPLANSIYSVPILIEMQICSDRWHSRSY